MDKKNRGYRKPVPVDIFNYPEFGYEERSLWFEIYLQCTNTDKRIKVKHGNRWVFVDLKCGQMLFNLSQYAEEHHKSRKYVKSLIESLSFGYSELHIMKHTCGLIITVLEHEELKKMNSERNIMRTSREHHENIMRASYSNKSGKSGRLLRSTTQEKKDFSDENHFYPAKTWKTWEDVPDKVIDRYDERYGLRKALWFDDLKHDRDNLRKMLFNYFTQNPNESITI